MRKIREEWQDDPAFPFKYHLYRIEELPGGTQEKKLLGSYWRTREQWEWHVFPLKRRLFQKANCGSSPTEEEAKKSIQNLLKQN